MNFSFKKNIVIIVIAAVLALGIGGTVIGVNVYNSPANRISRYLGAAERYLSEMNYEQAIIEFQNILEIEPMNVDAYLGLAEAYIGLGDTEKALEILREGLDKTGDSEIQEKIDELTNPEESAGDGSTESEPVESVPENVSTGSVTIAEREYDIATTTSLTIMYYRLTNEDVKQIGKLTNLTELTLHNNQISDITPLAGLTKLTHLYLFNNEINDITPLAGLTKLTRLSLKNNAIIDLTPLTGLTNLTDLELSENRISDISPLAGLTNLTKLDLSNNLSIISSGISDISPLAGLTNLTELHLNYNAVSDISPLAGLTNLTVLNISRNINGDISPLAGLTNLTDLRVSKHQLNDLSTLVGLPKLNSLWIVDIENLLRDADIINRVKEQLPNCHIQT